MSGMKKEKWMRRSMKMEVKRLRRPCKKCDEMFTPKGRFVRLCKKCLAKSQKEKYDKIKMERKQHCCICGEIIKHERIIEARKGKYYYFCQFHFETYRTKSLRVVREQIAFNKKLLKKQTFK